MALISKQRRQRPALGLLVMTRGIEPILNYWGIGVMSPAFVMGGGFHLPVSAFDFGA